MLENSLPLSNLKHLGISSSRSKSFVKHEMIVSAVLSAMGYDQAFFDEASTTLNRYLY